MIPLEELIKQNLCVRCSGKNDSMTHVCQSCWRENPEESSESNNEAEEIAQDMEMME